ncbi:hypothetical protein GCM10009831_04150 [Dietzia cercidiphylli]|uniref:Transposase n=1 Tax=Dietzia cercidiphylli TaxID=498199 RepID=A0ABN2I611_9ACTN
MRELLQTMINVLLYADADSAWGAEWNARTTDRTNRRNGYRLRPWTLASAPSTSPSRSCAQAATFPSGFSSAASGPSPR